VVLFGSDLICFENFFFFMKLLLITLAATPIMISKEFKLLVKFEVIVAVLLYFLGIFFLQ